MSGKKHIVSLILDPLTYFNLLVMAGSALWLLSVGHWHPVSLAIVTLLFYRFIIPIGLIPAGVLSNMMVSFGRVGKLHLERVFFFLSACHVFVILSLWCVAMLHFMVARVTPDMQLPALVLANAVAVGCLLLWVRNDRGNIFMVAVVEAAQVVMAILSYLHYSAEKQSFLRQFVFTVACLWGVALVQMLRDKIQAPNR